jgi:predicted nucleic acid-binding protein
VVSAYFLDSSALVKRYVAEAGTAWIQALTGPSARNQLIIARITCVEVVSALARRERTGVLPAAAVARAIDAFRYDLDIQYRVVELDRALAEMASQLVVKHPLRAYDAVQLASARRIQPAFGQAEPVSLIFLAADDRLLAIASAEGLPTDNPNRHP